MLFPSSLNSYWTPHCERSARKLASLKSSPPSPPSSETPLRPHGAPVTGHRAGHSGPRAHFLGPAVRHFPPHPAYPVPAPHNKCHPPALPVPRPCPTHAPDTANPSPTPAPFLPTNPAQSPNSAQIHRLVAKEGLVGAGCKAGYDGSYQQQPITNEVRLLSSKQRFLSTTQRRPSLLV